ncbi:MAG: amidase, partial [Terriglobia bacterium]
MSNSELCILSIDEVSQLLSRKEISPVTLVKAYLERIEKFDKAINSYVAVLAEQALSDAQRAEREIASGHWRGPLHGVSIALKDLFDIRGVATTGGSRLFSERIAKEDAACVTGLREAGAIVLGKTNMHELAYGATNEDSASGPTHNPWALDHIPGGSSGGSGAAVAADLCAGATGSDTGGSIRVPSALCGVVGLKPTFGRVSRRGVLPLSFTMDHAGPITKTAKDAALMLQAMAGYDSADTGSVNRPVPDFTTGIGEGIQGLKIALDPKWALANLEPGVQAAFEAALDVLRRLGCQVVEVTVLRISEGYEAGITMLACEAAALYEHDLKSRPQDFFPKVRDRLMNGLGLHGTDYARARETGEFIRRGLENALETVNLFVTPA